MCTMNKQSMQLVYKHFSDIYPNLAIWLAEEPSLMLPILNETLMDTLLHLYP